MAIDMSQFYQVFFEESAEHLAEMESLLLALDLDNPDPEELNAIFRAAHSIKGSSGTFGFKDMAETTHILENLLDRIRRHEVVLRRDMVDAFLEAGDVLKAMLAAHQGQKAVDADLAEIICHRLLHLSASASERPPLVKSASRVEPSPVPTPVRPARRTVCRRFDIQFVPTLASVKGEGIKNFIEDLRNLGEVEVVCQPEGTPDGVGLWQLYLKTDAEKNDFAEQLDFIADSGAWRIVEDTAANPDGGAAFGFFSDSPGLPDEERGYGFFDCDSPAEDLSQDDGYGFFEPLPGEVSALEGVAIDDGSYGFFGPPPVPSPSPTAPEGTQSSNDEGYGFFEPVPVRGDSLNSAERQVVSSAPPTSTAGEKTKDAGTQPDKQKGVSGVTVSGDSSIRVSIEKVDQLINLVGELVITQAMLLQTALQMQESAPERLLNGLTQLERNTRDLQESVMSIRMLPISFVFSRFPRVVRDLSSRLGKQVDLKTSGENTELDKGLIERIADPLTHLIRNSLDHGIELPEQRMAAGKSLVGTITLKAYHQGGNIVIEVGDDGAGLNRKRIMDKARERGLPVSDQMTDQEVFALIFEAGFSTAEQITDVSGRGVGMDVVRKNIHELGGRVEIESMSGIGTRITVRLPLTLAILDGMSVAVGDQTYILPLSSIVESLQPAEGDVKTLSNQGRVIKVRGEYLPVVALHEFFGLESNWKCFTQGIMVVVDADGMKAALFVDALVGQHQVVIKSLEANYRRVPGISGATIMGDGHVALIMDVSAIVSMARTGVQRAA